MISAGWGSLHSSTDAKSLGQPYDTDITFHLVAFAYRRHNKTPPAAPSAHQDPTYKVFARSQPAARASHAVSL